MNTLQLSSLGVQEMNSQEMQKTDGGIWPIFAAALLGAGAMEIIGNWDEFEQGLAEGWQAGSLNH